MDLSMPQQAQLTDKALNEMILPLTLPELHGGHLSRRENGRLKLTS